MVACSVMTALDLTPEIQLKFAKAIAPGIFQNATPRFHIDLLEFDRTAGPRAAEVVFRGGGKSTLKTKINTTARMFFLHEPFTVIVSENARKAQSFLRDIKMMVDDAHDKGFDIQRGDIWNESMIEVVTGGVRCAVAVFGAGEDPRGYVYRNQRPTRIIADDIESRELVKSKTQREKLAEWFFQDLLPALDPNGTFRIVGTIMHAEQLLSKILENPVWKHIIIPCYRPDGSATWKSRFPREKLEGIRLELESQGLFNAFPNEYLCVPQNEQKKLFRHEYYRYFEGISYLDDEREITFANVLQEMKIAIRTPEAVVLDDGEKIPYGDLAVYSTMDLASDGVDSTAIVTKGYDSQGREFLLNIAAGHWNPFEKSVHVIRVYLEFHPLRFGIEKAGAQNEFFYTIDVAQKEHGVYIPIEELRHGGVNKNIRIANMQPSYVAGKVYHNRSDPQTPRMEAQLGAFNIDIEGGIVDIIDAEAYQLQFSAGRQFTQPHDYNDEYNSGAWQ